MEMIFRELALESLVFVEIGSDVCLYICLCLLLLGESFATRMNHLL